MRTPRKNLVPLLALVFPVLLFAAYFQLAARAPDPESYFHLAVSRTIAHQHAPYLEMLPQSEEQGWEVYFPGRDFLFHALASVGYRAAGEAGAKLLIPLAATGGALALFWAALAFLTPGEAFAFTIAAFFVPPFLFPLLRFRPEVFSVFLFLFLSAALIRRRPLIAAFAAGALALAGPPIYVLLLFLLATASWALLERKQQGRALLFASTLFCMMCGVLLNPYFPTNAELEPINRVIPLFLPLLASALPVLFSRIPRRSIYLSGLAVVSLLWFAVNLRRAPAPDPFNSVPAAVAAIPAGEAKVFNGETDLAAFLFHARPDLRFVDILEGRDFQEGRPAMFSLRQDLGAGFITDPRAAIAELFGAQFAISRNPDLIRVLDGDAAFVRIFPAAPVPDTTAVFHVAKVPLPEFVRSFELRALSPSDFPGALDEGVEQKFDLPAFAVALGLRNLRKPGLNCAQIQASAADIKRLAGADYLGVGGGETIRAWRNGKFLPLLRHDFRQAKSVQALVRLQPPLAVGEKISLRVCSKPEAPFWSIALSLWTESQVRAVCADKGSPGLACFAPLEEQASRQAEQK
ncbi:MAG: hypothetical protein ACXWSC_06400 [Bdellovibrionota bacterium]